MNVVFDTDGLDGVAFAPMKHVQTGAIHRPAVAVAALRKRQTKESLAIDLDGLDGVAYSAPIPDTGAFKQPRAALKALKKEEEARTVAMPSIFGTDGVSSPPTKMGRSLPSSGRSSKSGVGAPRGTLSGLGKKLPKSTRAARGGPPRGLGIPLSPGPARKSPAKGAPRPPLSGFGIQALEVPKELEQLPDILQASDGIMSDVEVTMEDESKRLHPASVFAEAADDDLVEIAYGDTEAIPLATLQERAGAGASKRQDANVLTTRPFGADTLRAANSPDSDAPTPAVGVEAIASDDNAPKQPTYIPKTTPVSESEINEAPTIALSREVIERSMPAPKAPAPRPPKPPVLPVPVAPPPVLQQEDEFPIQPKKKSRSTFLLVAVVLHLVAIAIIFSFIISNSSVPTEVTKKSEDASATKPDTTKPDATDSPKVDGIDEQHGSTIAIADAASADDVPSEETNPDVIVPGVDAQAKDEALTPETDVEQDAVAANPLADAALVAAESDTSAEIGTDSAEEPAAPIAEPDAPSMPSGTKIAYPASFEEGRSWPTRAERQEVVDLALALKNGCAGKILITGHASESGPTKINYRMGMRRAEIVMEILAKKGIERRRMRAESAGSSNPIPGASPERNRRVVVTCE